MIYEELVNEMRYCVDGDKECAGCKRYGQMSCEVYLMEDAADAMGQLEKDVARAKEWASFWQKEATEALKKFQVAVASKPRWIPVTELPPEGETYGDTTFSVEVLGTEGFTYRKAYYNFKYKVWVDGNEEREWPSITHWMPLHMPPKEETDPCTDCRYYPPSSTDGKPCCACDPFNPLTNCHDAKKET